MTRKSKSLKSNDKKESFVILAIASSEFHGRKISLCQNVSSEIPFVRRQRIPLWLHTHTHTFLIVYTFFVRPYTIGYTVAFLSSGFTLRCVCICSFVQNLNHFGRYIQRIHRRWLNGSNNGQSCHVDLFYLWLYSNKSGMVVGSSKATSIFCVVLSNLINVIVFVICSFWQVGLCVRHS